MQCSHKLSHWTNHKIQNYCINNSILENYTVIYLQETFIIVVDGNFLWFYQPGVMTSTVPGVVIQDQLYEVVPG